MLGTALLSQSVLRAGPLQHACRNCTSFSICAACRSTPTRSATRSATRHATLYLAALRGSRVKKGKSLNGQSNSGQLRNGGAWTPSCSINARAGPTTPSLLACSATQTDSCRKAIQVGPFSTRRLLLGAVQMEQWFNEGSLKTFLCRSGSLGKVLQIEKYPGTHEDWKTFVNVFDLLVFPRDANPGRGDWCRSRWGWGCFVVVCLFWSNCESVLLTAKRLG